MTEGQVRPAGLPLKVRWVETACPSCRRPVWSWPDQRFNVCGWCHAIVRCR